MWRMEIFIDHVGSLASFIGSLTVVMGAVIWIWNKVVIRPREKIRRDLEEQRYQKMIDVATQEDKPLADAIVKLTAQLDDSRSDRKNLNQIADKLMEITQAQQEHSERQDERLDSHGDRILTLEVINGVSRVKYKEHYGKDEE